MQRSLENIEREEPSRAMLVATPFIQLDDAPGEPAAQQLVRVKLPRSALPSFGLPTNVERMHEPVDAEVLVGGDGLPRAIRFIHVSGRP
jgi:hypothetical protein